MGMSKITLRGKTYSTKRRRKHKKNRPITKKVVKRIVKKAITGAKEINHGTQVQSSLLAVGNPLLELNAGSFTDENIPKPRCILLTGYEMTHFVDKNTAVPTPTNQNGDLVYAQKQKMTIKNIQLKLEVRSPSTKIGVHDCSQWVDFHWAVIRTSSPTPTTGRLDVSKLFKDDWYESMGNYIRSDQCNRQGYSIVKQGRFAVNPIKSPVSLQDFSYRIVRKTINVRLNKKINLQRKVSSVNPDYTDATLAGNVNSSNYWVVLYVNQEKQIVNSGDFKYTNSNVSDPSNISASCFVKYKMTMSGFGEAD